jgi:tetratricopeptide (TPR) repeat protein
MSDEALANYMKAITISPKDEHLCFNIARIHYDKEEWDNALDWLRKAQEINSHFMEAQRFAALILKKMNELGITPSEDKPAEPQKVEEELPIDEIEELASKVNASVKPPQKN